MRKADGRSLVVLVFLVALAVIICAAIDPPPRVQGTDEAAPVIGLAPDGAISISAPPGDDIRFTVDGSLPDRTSLRWTGALPEWPQDDHLLVVPTSVQWRHPMGRLPRAHVLRAAVIDEKGRPGRIVQRTIVPQEHPGLAVWALTLPEGAFFDPDTGIYVVGHAIFDQAADFVQRYPEDQKWWKYPGNFHYRGQEAERTAHLEAVRDPSGSAEGLSADVRVRINGNNTRGFPQHALRIIFEDRLPFPVFGEQQSAGHERVILRAAGNDQDRAFFRDALQHRLCAMLPFETSACTPAVLYLNGTYWGLHHVRERLDDRELARRYGASRKKFTILADRLELYEGEKEEVDRFGRFLSRCERWAPDAPGTVDSLMKRMDVDGFLHYMAAQIILANTDWPEQNVKWWRYTGSPDTLGSPLDGRWRFIMGDSDMGIGMAVPPTYDMCRHITARRTAPVARLLVVCLRIPALRERFRSIVDELLTGPLSAERMTAAARSMHDRIVREMPVHIARWRRPLSVDRWEAQVADVLTFAQQRPAAARAEVQAYLSSFTTP